MSHAEASRLSISIVIPTKDRAGDLAQTLKCVRAQTRAPDELIVVDQSRAGDVGETLAGYTDPRPIHIRDTEIRGLPAARNVGFAASKGDLVCFFDDDVTLDPDYLAEMERGFKAFPGWAGLTGRLTEEGRDPARRGLKAALFRHRFLRDQRHALASLKAARAVPLMPGCAFCLRRAVLERFRFDDSLEGYALGEDVDFFLRAGKVFSFGAVPSAKAHHRRSKVGRAGGEKMHEAVKSSARYLWTRHRAGFVDDVAYVWFLLGSGLEARLARARVRLGSRPGFAGVIQDSPDSD
ncbi:MAG TPA: glycosyltransferase family 2 protein [Pyrinomonadaceae bacterium]|nr:glycosyltransferase family 2 protein [Pyrinomonadaceae bacterium]